MKARRLEVGGIALVQLPHRLLIRSIARLELALAVERFRRRDIRPLALGRGTGRMESLKRSPRRASTALAATESWSPQMGWS